MSIFLGIIGMLKWGAAVLIFVSAGSVMHEILAVLLLGFGTLTFGLAVIIDDMKS
ncbi:MAG: hypothetical protein JJU09_02695 [Rhodobacteraceae bacterium]|nr:hypothetical protein [Paracoccaceae bacterium]